jgi:hypothetical protein
MIEVHVYVALANSLVHVRALRTFVPLYHANWNMHEFADTLTACISYKQVQTQKELTIEVTR